MVVGKREEVREGLQPNNAVLEAIMRTLASTQRVWGEGRALGEP